MSPVLTFPHTWKSTKIFHGDVCSSRPAVTFYKNMCVVACPPSSPKSCIHWPSPLPLQSAFSKLCEAVVLILPQIKLNSQLSHCGVFGFFFQSTGNTARRLQSQTLNRVLLILQFLILSKWLAVWARSSLAMFSRRVKRYQGQGGKPTSQARSMATKQSLEELQRAWGRILSKGAKCLGRSQKQWLRSKHWEKKKKDKFGERLALWLGFWIWNNCMSIRLG